MATACSSTVAPQASPTEPITSGTNDDVLVVQPLDTAAIDTVLADWEGVADGGGIVLVRNEDGQSDSAAVGVDPESGERLSVDDRVRVGSISKVVSAVLVMQLVDEGLVALDAPVSTYLPDLELANDVTIQQLLGHTSGIPNYTERRGFSLMVMAQPSAEPTPTDLVSLVAGDTDFEPGAEFSYSNTNFIVLGMVVESVRGASLNEVLDEQINEPLGLTRTTFADGTLDDVVGGFSRMTRSGNSYDQSYTSVAYGSWAAGGLVTTVGELAAFFDGVFFGDLLAAESVTAMLGEIDAGAEYGLGLHGGADFGVGHGGSIVGFNSFAQIDRESGELVIVVVNSDSRSPSVLSADLTALIRPDS